MQAYAANAETYSACLSSTERHLGLLGTQAQCRGVRPYTSLHVSNSNITYIFFWNLPSYQTYIIIVTECCS